VNSRFAIVAALLVLLGLTLHQGSPVLACPESCFLDYVAMHGSEVGNFELPDARLNAWILGWVQHAGLTDPSRLFDANAFFPARNTLAGSEHMIGNALLTLPVRLFSDSAVALHQIAMVLSFGLLGMSVFVFVRWAGQSTWAALLAGAAAMYMPWRYSEVGHLQLLSAQWIPLVWWLTTRLLTGEGSRRDAVALSFALGIQLLTSFYLAYFVLFSGGCLAAGVAIQTRPSFRNWARLGFAYAVPMALLIALALPYLSRYSAYRFANPVVIPESTPPALALSFLAPSPTLFADYQRLSGVSYFIPLIVFALALVPFVRIFESSRSAAAREPTLRRIRITSIGLLAAIAGAFVLMLGRRLAIGDLEIPILATLFAKWVPGFSQMRAEFRWGIVIGIALPILAGLGIAVIERATAFRPRVQMALRLAIAAALALNTPWFELPVKPAWKQSTGIVAAHRALADLPPGTTVELPWGLKPIHIANSGSRYMLASSFDWNPLLNGYTAYPPASHFFLQRIAQSLPDVGALARLRRLTDLRWIVVHPTSAPMRMRWEQAVSRGLVELAFSEPNAQIFRVPEQPDGGILLDALVSETPRPRTFSGLSRDPLDMSRAIGRLSVSTPKTMQHQHDVGMKSWVEAAIRNDSAVDWPGFDIQTEGLIELRFRFIDDQGNVEYEDTASLDTDVMAGQMARTPVLVRPPSRSGLYTVRFDLVQRIGDEFHTLSPDAVERRVEVKSAGAASSRMRDELKRRAQDPTRLPPPKRVDDRREKLKNAGDIR
jgi:hypothetical protein